ncbi:hypothetical protein ScalyP_jg195 [Parmales sp. scaly parma]|nr:hypothetical protein ScalyP_jg195 [Parmales sp. scaly parma]
MSAFDHLQNEPLGQDVLDAGASLGLDVRAIRQKYATQKIVDNLGTSENAIKMKSMLEDAERMSAMEAESETDPEAKAKSKAKNTSSTSSRLDRVVVCQRCLGQGLVKSEYNYQIRETNCDECDSEGVLWRGEEGRLLKMSESKEVRREKTAEEMEAFVLAARKLAGGSARGGGGKVVQGIEATEKLNFVDGLPVRVTMSGSGGEFNGAPPIL